MQCDWISVGDELPDDEIHQKQMCIVWDEETMNAPIVARYIGGRQFHDFFKNWVKVSYWMPMPEPPQRDYEEHR